jgi:nucleotide-binding universal stress UspA family protein
VLVGYSESEHGLRAARHAALLATHLDRDLEVVAVAKRQDEVVQPDRELAGELYLAASGGNIGGVRPPLDPNVSVVHENGDPADVIVRVARVRAAAVIITGTRGRNAFTSAILGSVSAGVVAIADRPVGLVPASVRDD